MCTVEDYISAAVKGNWHAFVSDLDEYNNKFIEDCTYKGCIGVM